MMLRYALGEAAAADAIEAAVQKVIQAGLRTGDIWSEGTTKLVTAEMGIAVAAAIQTA
jgi:3-isopropylmalate dehydrogenase